MLRRLERPEWAINPPFSAARVNRRVGCEQSLADLAVNGEVAPISAVGEANIETPEATSREHSVAAPADGRVGRKRPFGRVFSTSRLTYR